MKAFFKIFHLHNKWVRMMLVTSVVIILGIIIYPEAKEEAAPVVMMQMDSVAGKSLGDTKSMIDDTVRSQARIKRPMEAISGTPPLQVQIVEAKKPFDWKGTFTWVIGGINGLVLLILNLKKLFSKSVTA